MHPQTSYININAEAFSPLVLRLSFFTAGKEFPKGYKFDKRYTCDYEIEFFTYSQGSIMIEDKDYEICEGDICFRRPGELVQGTLPYNCYLLCFDLLGNTGKISDTYDFLDDTKLQVNYVNSILESIPPVFHPTIPETYKTLFENMLKEYISPTSASSLMLKSQVLQLIYQLYKDSTDPLNNSIPNTAYYSHIKQAKYYIEENFQRKILLSDIADTVELSPNYFHKIFTETLKLTPNQYLTKLRLDKAKELLIKTNISISEIALECGFENIPYFSYIFKSNFNISPVNFRKKYSYTDA